MNEDKKEEKPVEDINQEAKDEGDEIWSDKDSKPTYYQIDKNFLVAFGVLGLIALLITLFLGVSFNARLSNLEGGDILFTSQLMQLGQSQQSLACHQIASYKIFSELGYTSFSPSLQSILDDCIREGILQVSPDLNLKKDLTLTESIDYYGVEFD